MNPEFRRNVWLELTPLRMIVMVAVLALAFFAAAVADGPIAGPGSMARWAFYIIVVLWGTRNAARSVVGEIRDRTWDGQRLSSLGAGTMMWGKLFGSTIYNWFGGAICLAVIAADTFDRSGPTSALAHLGYYIALGAISQAASLLASLIAVRRRQMRTQFEVFFYQAMGILAGVVVWAIADPNGLSLGGWPRAELIRWWGLMWPSEPFLLVSLAVFTGWMLTGCYRQMRLELKLRNTPIVWLAFSVFMAAYVAGFDAWMWGDARLAEFDVAARRLFLAGMTSAVIAYAMVILEPKNRVQFRWLGAALGRFRIGSAMAGLPCWSISYFAALIIGVTLVVRLGMSGNADGQAHIGAMLGFLSRDMALVVLFSVIARRRGGDFMAIAVLILLYALMPPIIAGLHYGMGQALFVPRATDPVWLSPLAAWGEAVVVWVLAIASISLPEKDALSN